MRRTGILAVVAGTLLTAPPAWAEALSLADALTMAMVRHPSVGVQAIQVQQANVDYWRAQFQRAVLNVDLNGGNNYSVSGMSTASQKDQNVLFTNAGTSLRVPLFTGWRITGGVERAEQGVAEQRSGLFTARQNLAMSVIEAYWDNQRQQQLRRRRSTNWP
jgi:outer membrane protein TolC